MQMQNDTFKLVLESNIFTIPSLFKHLMDISPSISKYLIFNPEHQYLVKSKVRKEIFQSFLNYLITDNFPDIQIDTFNEYLQLSNEFEILKDYIDQRRNQLGEYLVNLNGLRDNQNENFQIFAEKISIQLDDYIERYGIELMKCPIQSLFIVFNHKKRKLNNHNLAYDLIKQHFEKTNDSSVFILLKSLDGSKMTRNNLKESFSMCEERMGNMPNINFKVLAEMIDKQSIVEKKILEIEKESQENKKKFESEKKLMIESNQKSINDILAKQEKMFDELQKKHSKEIQSLNETINMLSKKIEEMKEQNENALKIIHEKVNSNENRINEIEKFEQIKEMKEQISKIDEITKKEESQISTINEEIKNIETINKKIENHSNLFEGISRKFEILNCKMSLKESGILECLKKKEKTPFDKLFVASQSSRDIYNLIDPNTKDEFKGSSKGNTYIEFYIKREITINGIRIYSSFEFFPKSFDIEIDGNKVKSIEEASELNGPDKEMTLEFDPVCCQKVRFIQTGKNWDKGSGYIRIKRIELLSNHSQYANGVFSTLVDQSENHDPHKCPVIIYSNRFDFNKFHSLNVPAYQNICTYDKENSWFQIEFTQGFAVLNGFRLKRVHPNKPKHYKIICSDDSNKKINSWLELIEIKEKAENENQDPDIYEFHNSSPPVKFIRLIQEGKTWNNNNFLAFFHIDFFGVYFT